jgi:hypothetical protein
MAVQKSSVPNLDSTTEQKAFHEGNVERVCKPATILLRSPASALWQQLPSDHPQSCRL